MFENIKNIFKKNESEKIFKNEQLSLNHCNNCSRFNTCETANTSESYLCVFEPKKFTYDPNKKTMLLLDDNIGIISSLKGDIEELEFQGKINLSEWNIITFSSQNAAFILKATLNKYKDFKVDYAILDLTLGGSFYTAEVGNVMFDGLDAAISLHERNKDVKFVFFTGNIINNHIKKFKNIEEKFKSVFNDDMKKYVLYKSSLNVEDRIEFLGEFFT